MHAIINLPRRPFFCITCGPNGKYKPHISPLKCRIGPTNKGIHQNPSILFFSQDYFYYESGLQLLFQAQLR